ncbi:MAG TPA: hypothetical protein VJK09_02270 [Candidatus Paceibacterota bacterium]
MRKSNRNEPEDLAIAVCDIHFPYRGQAPVNSGLLIRSKLVEVGVHNEKIERILVLARSLPNRSNLLHGVRSILAGEKKK